MASGRLASPSKSTDSMRLSQAVHVERKSNNSHHAVEPIGFDQAIVRFQYTHVGDILMRATRFVPGYGVLILSIVVGTQVAWAQPEQAEGKKIAVLVGVNNYQNRKLPNLEYAEKDMNDLSAILKRSGFDVRLLLGSSKGKEQATRENIEFALLDVLKGVGKSDMVLLAFSGHGQQFPVKLKDSDGREVSKEVPFFCPREAVPTDETTLISLNHVLKMLDEKGGGHNLLLVDACRSVPPDPGKGARGGIDGSRVDNLGEGTAVFFACSKRQQARETEKAGGGHGIFFHFVLEGLNGAPEARNSEGQVTWDRLVPFVKQRVKKEFPNWFASVPELERQVPHAIGNLAGDPVLVSMSNTNELADHFQKYRRALYTGRGSVAFLKETAPANFAAWMERADAGDAIAQLFVGRCYQEGVAVQEDQNSAMVWLEKSAARGNDFAMHTLGNTFDAGYGSISRKPEEAIRWYSRAAERGNGASMLHLGNLSLRAPNNDPQLAFRWHRKAADAGNAVAMRTVGDAYLNGTGVPKDPSEGEKWLERAAQAGEVQTIGKLFGKRIVQHVSAYLATDATDSTKSAAISALRSLQKEYQAFDVAIVNSIFSKSDLSLSTDKINALSKDDPLQLLRNELLQRYFELFAAAPKYVRLGDFSNFSTSASPLVSTWYRDSRYRQVADFWERAFKDISVPELDIELDQCDTIREMNYAVNSLFRTGKRKEAKDLLNGGLAMCDAILRERPWDFYTKESYLGLCFSTAETLTEIGDPAEVQPLLQRGWKIYAHRYGKESLMNSYAKLPLKGKLPDGVSESDREFFEMYVPDTKKSGIKRFTIPTDFSGTKYPFYVYIFNGPRGYAELQDQFRWVREIRGGEIPTDVVDSFSRLNKIAVENNVDFQELCVYALATTNQGESTTPASNDNETKDKPKDSDKPAAKPAGSDKPSDATETAIRRVVSKHFPSVPAKIDQKSPLKLDDLDRVELVMALEEEFRITIADSVAEKFTGKEVTVEKLIKMVNESRNAPK